MIDSLLQIVFYIIVAVGIGVLFGSLIPPVTIPTRLQMHGVSFDERELDCKMGEGVVDYLTREE